MAACLVCAVVAFYCSEELTWSILIQQGVSDLSIWRHSQIFKVIFSNLWSNLLTHYSVMWIKRRWERLRHKLLALGVYTAILSFFSISFPSKDHSCILSHSFFLLAGLPTFLDVVRPHIAVGVNQRISCATEKSPSSVFARLLDAGLFVFKIGLPSNFVTSILILRWSSFKGARSSETFKIIVIVD